MSDSRHSNEFEDVERLLRQERPEATPLELDNIKLEAKSRASRTGRRTSGGFMRKKAITFVLTGVLMTSGGTAAVIAGGKGHHKGKNSGKGQYCPPGHGKHKGKHGGKHGSDRCPRGSDRDSSDGGSSDGGSSDGGGKGGGSDSDRGS